MIRVMLFSRRKLREPFPLFWNSQLRPQHLLHLCSEPKQKKIILWGVCCRAMGDSSRLTVASSNPVMLTVPQLMYGADSWRAALLGLDLFNPADQPSDESMCAGNRCHMRWGLVDATDKWDHTLAHMQAQTSSETLKLLWEAITNVQIKKVNI